MGGIETFSGEQPATRKILTETTMFEKRPAKYALNKWSEKQLEQRTQALRDSCSRCARQACQEMGRRLGIVN
jgi:hypothetical protein